MQYEVKGNILGIRYETGDPIWQKYVGIMKNTDPGKTVRTAVKTWSDCLGPKITRSLSNIVCRIHCIGSIHLAAGVERLPEHFCSHCAQHHPTGLLPGYASS